MKARCAARSHQTLPARRLPCVIDRDSLELQTRSYDVNPNQRLSFSLSLSPFCLSASLSLSLCRCRRSFAFVPLDLSLVTYETALFLSDERTNEVEIEGKGGGIETIAGKQ